jgi:type VI secretion system protein ImpH
MASDHRQPGADLTLYQQLQRTPFRFGFLLTLRRLDCLHHDRPPTGLAVRAGDEPLRLGQYPGLDFPAANMHSCEPTADGLRWRLRSRFLGVFGANGPLPLHLTEFARDRMRRHQDETFASFMDMFHHRLLSLFYRAWASGQPTVQLDRVESDRFSVHVGALIGLGSDAFRHRDAVSDHAKMHFAGRLVGQSRNAEGLEALLGHFFQMPCKVEQFAGHWMRLPDDCGTRLGKLAQSATLGQSAICGSRVWDTQSKFRLVFGPIDFAQFCRLLPGRGGLNRLIALVRNYVGDELLWDIRLNLQREAIPQTRLGSQGQLGWTSFLISKTPQSDSDAAVFTPTY